MKKLLLSILGLVVLAAIAAVIWAFSTSGHKKAVVILSYTEDPFRNVVSSAFVRELCKLETELKLSDFETVFFRSIQTTDDVEWDSLPPSRTVLCMLAPGRSPLPPNRRIVMGPLRSAWRGFAQLNRSTAFLVSDLYNWPFGEIFEKGLGFQMNRVYLASAGSADVATSPYSIPGATLMDCKYMGRTDESGLVMRIPEGSLVFLACDGDEGPSVEAFAEAALERRIGVCVDRVGYLSASVLAVVSVDPDVVGDALARLAVKSLAGIEFDGETREITTAIKLYNSEVAKKLGLEDKATFGGFRKAR